MFFCYLPKCSLFSPQLASNASLSTKPVQISVGTQTEVIDFEMLPPTIKKKPQTPAELEQALALEQSRVAALKEELAAVRTISILIDRDFNYASLVT